MFTFFAITIVIVVKTRPEYFFKHPHSLSIWHHETWVITYALDLNIAMAYIETPRTDAGNSTYMSNAYNLENFSMEKSFLSPTKKKKDDLVSQIRKGRGSSLKTPRSRVPLTDRPNLHTAAQGEFTPLLRSAVRNNSLRKENRGGAPKTPAFLKNGYKDASSPSLPRPEMSRIYDEDSGSSGLVDGASTPALPPSSSVKLTPLAALPKRDAGGVLADQGNVMTLREQENVGVSFLMGISVRSNMRIDH